MSNSSVWLAGPIVVGFIALIAIAYAIYNCVRRSRMRKVLQTQVVNQQTIAFGGMPATAMPPIKNNYNMGFQGMNNAAMGMGGNMVMNQGMNPGMNMGGAISMGVGMSQGSQAFNYGNPTPMGHQNMYDPLHPMQNNISMGLENALISPNF